MPHKADAHFFDYKKPWSQRKDLILQYYLKPYLPKVSTLDRPILIVDGFAGPGRFKDGTPGSPLIICKAVAEYLANKHRQPATVLCVERDAQLYAELRNNLAEFSFAEPINSDFLDAIPLIEKRANTHTLFLYIDPFTLEGVDWQALDRLFQNLKFRSVEFLLNFQALIFLRIARSIKGFVKPESFNANSTIQSLSRAVGGQWWLAHVPLWTKRTEEAVRDLTMSFCSKVRERFPEVCCHDVKARWRNKIPKYTLVFGSRHPDATLLMNDAMAKSRSELANQALPMNPTLFETRPKELVPDKEELKQAILTLTDKPTARINVVMAVIRRHFSHYTSSEIRIAIGELIKAGELISNTGKSKINNDVPIWKRC